MQTHQELRPIYAIAQDIATHWQVVYFGAVPYLSAMCEMRYISDKYYGDDGPTIITYFLANAGSFRGLKAKKLKDELKAHLKQVR